MPIYTTVGRSTHNVGQVINGTADEIQLRIQGNGTQTSSLFVLEQSDGTDVFVVSDAGIMRAIGQQIFNAAEGLTGSMNFRSAREVVTMTGSQVSSTTLDIPSGALILGGSFTVDTAVVTSSATNTWDADLTGGSTTTLVAAGAAGAQNTKANSLIAPELLSAETNVEFDAPGAETFSSGAIEIVLYYIDLTGLANV